MKKQTLAMRMSRRDGWTYHYPTSKSDGHLLHAMVSGYKSWPEFEKELVARGYDLSSLRMSVSLRPEVTEEGIRRRAEQDRCDAEDWALRACVSERLD